MHRNHRLTRRATLAGLGAGAVALAVGGCTLGQAKSPTEAVRTDPLGPLYTETIGLIGSYDQTIAGQPELAPTIGRLRDEHRQHAIALASLMSIAAPAIGIGPDASGVSVKPSAPPSVPASPSGPVSPAVSGSPSTNPADPAAAARAALREAEKTAQLNTVAACLDARADRVAILASMAASRATHVAALAGLT